VGNLNTHHHTTWFATHSRHCRSQLDCGWLVRWPVLPHPPAHYCVPSALHRCVSRWCPVSPRLPAVRLSFHHRSPTFLAVSFTVFESASRRTPPHQPRIRLSPPPPPLRVPPRCVPRLLFLVKHTWPPARTTDCIKSTTTTTTTISHTTTATPRNARQGPLLVLHDLHTHSREVHPTHLAPLLTARCVVRTVPCPSLRSPRIHEVYLVPPHTPTRIDLVVVHRSHPPPHLRLPPWTAPLPLHPLPRIALPPPTTTTTRFVPHIPCAPLREDARLSAAPSTHTPPHPRTHSLTPTVNRC
jgi:hypothetical protein